MAKNPVSIQMYTLREECQKDFVGTLKKVASLGFDGVEFAGYYGLEAAELKGILDELGLQASGSHVPLAMLETELDDVIAYQKAIGSKHIICPILPEEHQGSLANYSEVAKRLNEFGEKCANNDITFSYHNHAFEIEKTEGESPLDVLLRETNPEWVKAELDIYWVKRAGENPIDWMNKYEGRIPLLHLKDMTTDGEQFFAELGTGGIAIPEVIEKGKNIGVEWFVVEQDQSRRNPLESIEISINYLKNNSLL